MQGQSRARGRSSLRGASYLAGDLHVFASTRCCRRIVTYCVLSGRRAHRMRDISAENIPTYHRLNVCHLIVLGTVP